jgi:hypothetical protein
MGFAQRLDAVVSDEDEAGQRESTWGRETKNARLLRMTLLHIACPIA